MGQLVGTESRPVIPIPNEWASKEWEGKIMSKANEGGTFVIFYFPSPDNGEWVEAFRFPLFAKIRRDLVRDETEWVK